MVDCRAIRAFASSLVLRITEENSMSCSNYPQTSPSDTDGSLLVYANKSGTAALVLSTSAKVLPPAGAAFAQGLALGLAANFRVPASTVAGVTAAINSQPNNGIVGEA